ncbi:MAG: class I SAM-dependent methyltransferase [Candidatus Krumholzibacteria bacterium]|nr:class I SAM-dependent methyltransferase [Candidatus Krumholzibacteria bacterium]
MANLSVRRFLRKLPRSQAERRHAMVGPAHLWKMKRDFQIDFLRGRGLSPQHYMLDIGCGTLRGGIPLIDYLEPGHYYGVESRAEVIDEGKQELQKERLENKAPVLIAAEDIAMVEIEQDFDYAWAFSVLIHMTDEVLRDCLGLVAGRLNPDGVFYANVNIGEAPPGNWQGFPVIYRSLTAYEEQCASHSLRVTDIGSLGELGHVSGDEAQDQQRMLEIRPA